MAALSQVTFIESKFLTGAKHLETLDLRPLASVHTVQDDFCSGEIISIVALECSHLRVYSLFASFVLLLYMCFVYRLRDRA